MVAFKKGDKVEFVTGSRTHRGVFVRQFYPGSQSQAGPHFRIEIAGGTVATIFANGVVGKSVKKINSH